MCDIALSKNEFMTKNLKDLGKLKRELEVEIPLEEIKPAYDKMFHQLKSVKLRGFRPGKFPKGWIQKRFQEQMTVEARDHVIPEYFNQIVDEMELKPATQAVIEDLSFDVKKPMSFRLLFEVRPDLPPLDYQKLKLEKQEIQIESEDQEAMIAQMRRDYAIPEAKPDDSVAEEGDRVRVDFKRTIGEEVTEQTAQYFELGENILPEIKANILGMKMEESKEFSFVMTEEYMKEHAGETVTFELTITGLEKVVLPEMNEAFFQNFDNAQNEEEFRQYVENQSKVRKESEVRQAYYQTLREQLTACYDEFELPEQLLQERETQAEESLRKSNPEITDEELASSQAKQMAQYKTQLRMEYILEQIALAESLKPEEEAVARRFASIAQMYGTHPRDFLQSQIGPFFYRQIYQQIYEETVLDFLIKQILGATETVAIEA